MRADRPTDRGACTQDLRLCREPATGSASRHHHCHHGEGASWPCQSVDGHPDLDGANMRAHPRNIIKKEESVNVTLDSRPAVDRIKERKGMSILHASIRFVHIRIRGVWVGAGLSLLKPMTSGVDEQPSHHDQRTLDLSNDDFTSAIPPELLHDFRQAGRPAGRGMIGRCIRGGWYLTG